MPLSPKMAQVLDLDEDAEADAVAESMALLMKCPPPRSPAEVALWTRFADSIEDLLVAPGPDLYNDAEAANAVVHVAMHEGSEAWRAVLDTDDVNSDLRLRFMKYVFAELVRAGALRPDPPHGWPEFPGP